MKLHSSFWLDEKNFNKLGKRDELDPMELVKYQRSIGKFVKILTKEHIPVTFKTRDGVDGNSYTDGKSVVIGSNITQKNFDSVVGLALHEGSHILLSDFSIFPNFKKEIREMLENRFGYDYEELTGWQEELENNIRIFKSLLNYVEDRRIDYYVQKNSPGYKGYYEAMYDRYFKDHIIDKAIASDKFTDVTLSSYMYRIINFINDNTRFDALPDLEEIYNLIFDNVSSLKSIQDSMDITFKIYRIIKENVNEAEEQKKQEEGEEESDENGEKENGSEGSNSTTGESSDEDGVNTSMDGEGDSMEEPDSSNDESEDEESGDDESDEDKGASSSNGSETDETESSNESDDDESENDSDSDESEDEDSESESDESESESDDESDNEDGESDNSSDEDSESESDDESNESDEDNEDVERPELTDRQEKELSKRLEKQEKFLDGEIYKRTVDKKTKELVDIISDIDFDQKEVEFGEFNTKVDVSVIRGFNDKTIQLVRAVERQKERIEAGYSDGLTDTVNEGIRLGRRLGKKLQIRNRERTTTYNRKKKGKLDKRRIHALGFRDENVFNQYVTEKHEDAFIHLSIDASASMDGKKFKNAIKSAVAIAQMADMTNIDVEISLRYITKIANKEQPILWIVYNSKKDSIDTIKKNFKYLAATECTPEGLCFNTILKQLPKGSDVLKTYFINYSDGMPYWWGTGYKGNAAIEHTKKQVKEIEKLGYTILSFFISDSEYDNKDKKSDFQKMYGRNSTFINPTELTQLVKELKSMFLKK